MYLSFEAAEGETVSLSYQISREVFNEGQRKGANTSDVASVKEGRDDYSADDLSIFPTEVLNYILRTCRTQGAVKPELNEMILRVHRAVCRLWRALTPPPPRTLP